MSNKPANRPSTTRKHTTKTDAHREEALSLGYRLTIDGEVYEAQLGDVTPRLARELRRETGRGFMGLLKALSVDADVDLISEAVWVARRIRGEQVDVDDVEVGYKELLGDDFTIEVADGEASTPDPEA